jgi:hypothetical protein
VARLVQDVAGVEQLLPVDNQLAPINEQAGQERRRPTW